MRIVYRFQWGYRHYVALDQAELMRFGMWLTGESVETDQFKSSGKIEGIEFIDGWISLRI